MGGGHGQQKSQPKIIFKNHSLPLDSIGPLLKEKFGISISQLVGTAIKSTETSS